MHSVNVGFDGLGKWFIVSCQCIVIILIIIMINSIKEA